jgi:hypothetical protein
MTFPNRDVEQISRALRAALDRRTTCREHGIQLDANGRQCPDCLIESRTGEPIKSIRSIMEAKSR